MQNNNEITLDVLKKNSVFSGAIKNLSSEKQQVVFKQIQNISGESIDQNELKVIMYLLDSNLEKVGSSEKFVMDGNFNVENKSGFFEVTPRELIGLKQIPQAYDFDNGEAFPTIDKNNVVTITDKQGNVVFQQKLNE